MTFRLNSLKVHHKRSLKLKMSTLLKTWLTKKTFVLRFIISWFILDFSLWLENTFWNWN